MNLAIIRWRIAPSGGAEQFIVDTSNGLAKKGVEVSLIAEEWGRPIAFNGRFIKLSPSKGTRGHRYRAFQKSVADTLAQNSFNFVQSHERLLTADIFRAGDGVHVAWFERLKKNRSWGRSLMMRADPLHRIYMETERKMARETDMIFVAISNLVARELRQWLDVPDERIRVIENGVDLTRFKPATPEEHAAARARLGIAAEGPVACYVGSGFERKGAFQLVRALADPRLKDLTVIIAGRDKTEKALMRRIDSLGLSKRVFMMGSVGDVRPMLWAADLFVLPTMYDPGPIAALEALAAGLPVVITPDTGIAEAISETGAGMVASRDPEALAEAIVCVLGDLAAARQAVLALSPRFGLPQAVAKWLDLYGALS